MAYTKLEFLKTELDNFCKMHLVPIMHKMIYLVALHLRQTHFCAQIIQIGVIIKPI